MHAFNQIPDQWNESSGSGFYSKIISDDRPNEM